MPHLLLPFSMNGVQLFRRVAFRRPGYGAAPVVTGTRGARFVVCGELCHRGIVFLEQDAGGRERIVAGDVFRAFVLKFHVSQGLGIEPIAYARKRILQGRVYA